VGRLKRFGSILAREWRLTCGSHAAPLQLKTLSEAYLGSVFVPGSHDFSRYQYSSLYRVQSYEPLQNCPHAAYISSLFPPLHLLSTTLSQITLTSSIRQPILTRPTELSTTSHCSAARVVYPQLISDLPICVSLSNNLLSQPFTISRTPFTIR